MNEKVNIGEVGCPICKLEQHCCCRSCIGRYPVGTVLQFWQDAEVGIVGCGDCGYLLSAHQWDDLEYKWIVGVTGKSRIS